MVRLAATLLIALVLFGCQQTREPIALDELATSARGGDAAARKELVQLLAAGNERTNDRVYALILEIGDGMEPALLPAVTDSDRIRREFVIGALGNLKSKTAIPAISKVLADSKLKRRYIAAWALGEIGTEASVAPLVGSLSDADEEVRKYATRSLIKLNRLSVKPLVTLLEQKPGPAATGAAIRALGDIADPLSLEVLLKQLEGSGRAEAVTALGKLKDVRAVSALVSVLHDPDWQVRMNAATALGPIGGPEQAPQLETLLEDEVNVVREWAARSLEMMTGKRYTYRNEAGEYVQPYNIYH